MTDEQIKQNADAYANSLRLSTENPPSDYHIGIYDGYLIGAHSRDEEIEELNNLLNEAIHMLRDTYAGSSFFCDRFMSIPEEVKYCMTYCDKEEAQCDCVLRYLKLNMKSKKKINMKTKITPFDLETAKKIQAGEIEGKIVRNGLEVIILDYNSKKYSGYPIRIAYLDNDEVDYVTHEGLHIEVPDNEPQFKPFDKVLVRQSDKDAWRVALYSHFNSEENIHVTAWLNWYQCIPYAGNENLVGTTDKPKEE